MELCLHENIIALQQNQTSLERTSPVSSLHAAGLVFGCKKGGSNIAASGPLLLQTASFQVADCQTRLQWRQLRRAHKRLDRTNCAIKHTRSLLLDKSQATSRLTASQARRHQRRITVTNVIVSLPPPPPGSWA